MNNSYNERSMKIIDLKKTILEDNDVDADRLREELKKKNVFYMNVMSSPGSGKTTTIVGTIERLRKHFNIGVMEADIDSDVDALTVAKAGVSAVQLHTGGMCHLDADMSRQGMAALEAEADNTLDFIILENVGNLVCPAEFDTGACLNVAILSVPEGDDNLLGLSIYQGRLVIYYQMGDKKSYACGIIIKAGGEAMGGIPAVTVGEEEADPSSLTMLMQGVWGKKSD